ncbi:MAG TPA: hypothetical protein DEB40_11025 [Elusimicrobia bacterium]|nr:hypothetical protein [Elusimicrobiota bacterium]HBT62263.1 hypothetical protein [Elusimicrobiota bacterium]
MTKDAHHQRRRRHERCLFDLPLVLRDPAGRLIDARAVAHDVTIEGFGFETKAGLKDLSRVGFVLSLPDGGTVSGSARLAWCRALDWGGSWGGAKIARLPWREARKIRRLLHGPGYDWSGLADRALVGGAVVIVVCLGDMILRSDPRVLRQALLAGPWLLMGLGLGFFIHHALRDG